MLVASLIYAAGYFLVGQAGGLVMIIIAIVIITTAEIIESPTAAAYISSMAPSNEAGAYMGAHSMANLMGWLMGPMVGGLFLDNASSYKLAWTEISSLGIIAAIGFTWLMIKDSRKSTTSH
jgi:MFS family permease